MKEKLYVHHHLGLGDHFDCNGMVRYILKESLFDKVAVFCKDSNFSMVEQMYRDNENIETIQLKSDPNLHGKFDSNEYSQVREIVGGKAVLASSFPQIINSDEKDQQALLVVGHDFYRGVEGKNCWEIFYDQVNLPCEVRKDYFYIERDIKEESRVFDKKNPNREPFIFIHEDKDRGFAIDRKHLMNKNCLVVENDISENIFSFIKILEEAEEIHCMESSFKTLIDVYCEQENLFFHDFRGHPLGSKSNKSWKTIKYEEPTFY